MTGFAAAFGFEWLKFRRAPVSRIATIVLVVVVPGVATGLLAAARSDSRGQLALKARAMVTGAGWTGQFSVAGQILSVAVLVIVGIVAAWVFGREYTDRTDTALSALSVPRTVIAAAKFAVVALWGALAVAAAGLATVLYGLPGADGAPSAGAWAVFGQVLVAGAATVVLCAPLALAAILGRGYLTGVGVLMVIIVVSQLATVAGFGGWFPYSAPGLWLGIGGIEAARQVTTMQLLLPIPVAAVAVAGTVWWWRRPRLG